MSIMVETDSVGNQSTVINHQQQLHFIHKSDGNIECHGLLPGQQLLQTPDGRLSLICSGAHETAVAKYSLNQLVQLKSDLVTLFDIEAHFGPHQSEKLKSAIGQVKEIEPSGKLVIEFDNPEIHQWLLMPSAWLDPFHPANPSFNKEYLELVSKEVDLFFKVVDGGDLRVAKLLHNRHGVSAESRSADGRTALHIASLKGHYDLVEWLLKEAKVDVNNPDSRGYCAVHYAVLGCRTKVLELLMNYQADIYFQDLEGNTPIHLAILNERDPCLDVIMPRLPNFLNVKLRNKKGFSIVHLAVINNNLKAMEFIVKEEDITKILLERLPNINCTVLHYACRHKNYQMAKLLLKGSVDRSFLEARNESGMTALLIACWKGDYAIIELLVEAGADVRAISSQSGNSAILVAASSPAGDQIPFEQFSPGIYKIYKMIECHPILAVIAYLMSKGSPLGTVNKIGRKFTDGLPEIVANVLNQLASGGSINKDLLNCLPKLSNMSWINKRNSPVTEGKSTTFKWILDSSRYGYLQDGFGNSYTWCGTRSDGSINYRCVTIVDCVKRERCSSVARRIQSEKGNWVVLSVSPHNHSLSGSKRKLDEESKSGGPSLLKKNRI